MSTVKMSRLQTSGHPNVLTICALLTPMLVSCTSWNSRRVNVEENLGTGPIAEYVSAALPGMSESFYYNGFDRNIEDRVASNCTPVSVACLEKLGFTCPQSLSEPCSYEGSIKVMRRDGEGWFSRSVTISLTTQSELKASHVVKQDDHMRVIK
tara:strand:+ start:1283 stop:1741 length:459 start_codon:yes stop_codon:yes gene_type:complete